VVDVDGVLGEEVETADGSFHTAGAACKAANVIDQTEGSNQSQETR
jgi:hypothetical protein